MPRGAREIIPGMPLHIFQQGQYEQQCFFEERDYRRYLEWMATYATESGCAIHAFVLMPTHLRLLLTPCEKQSASRFMMQLGRRYAHYVNRAYNRRGSLFEKGFRSAVLTDPEDVLMCHWYIEHNPVRAMLVERPRDYRWSSYHANARAMKNRLLVPHAVYEQLGTTPRERALEYCRQSHTELDPAHEYGAVFLPLPT